MAARFTDPLAVTFVAETETARTSGGGPSEPFETKQPPGLWVLFITEMWERFSYYGMRALLVLYLVASTARTLEGGEANYNPGFGWEKEDAYLLYGVYTFMVYVTSIFGGMIADQFFGTHRSLLVGGTIIALGHVALALTELFSITPGVAVSMQSSPGALLMFLFGLALIIIGTGFFKPCVSVMVGQLYRENDPRRDSGFTIFYMGINLGALFSPLVAGTLGEKVGWHWGFGSAAVGMVAGLAFYYAFRHRYLEGVGDAPRISWTQGDTLRFVGLLALLVGIPGVPLVLYAGGGLGPIATGFSTLTSTTAGQVGFGLSFTAVILGSVFVFLGRQASEERSRLAVVFILAFLGNIAFWSAFEQAGSTLNVFAKESTNRMIGGWEFPASYLQSVNPLAILLFAPVFAAIWLYLEKQNRDLSTPMKFAAGQYLLGLAFIAMVFGAMQARDGGLASPMYLFVFYVVVTWGELCLSPVGLSMVTKLSPVRLQSLMMGLWFFSLALSNLCAGVVATVSVKFKDGELDYLIPGLPGFFLLLTTAAVVTGTLLVVLTPVLRKMMRGIH